MFPALTALGTLSAFWTFATLGTGTALTALGAGTAFALTLYIAFGLFEQYAAA